MKTLLSLAFLLATATLSACVTADSVAEGRDATTILECDATDLADRDFEIIEVNAVLGTDSISGLDTIGAPGEALAAAPSACDCTDSNCVVDYIEDHFGCGLCAHIDCGGTMLGGCVACPEVGTDADASPETCVIAPVEQNAPL